MKRTNVVLDEKLLEEARQVSGERTYSGAITKALQEMTRVNRLKRDLEDWQKLAEDGGIFWPGYLKEIRPNAYPLPKKRISAHEKRAPRAKGDKRDSR